MMPSNYYRANARERLGGKWSTFALMCFLYSLIIGAAAGLSRVRVLAFFMSIAIVIVEGPFTLSFAMASLSVARREPLKVSALFDGFKQFGRALGMQLLNGLLIFLWSLLFIIPGIIMSYAYSMSFYILADDPTVSVNEARKRSVAMMRGKKWRLFCLHFSFIGWYLLSILTFGILLYWVLPYVETAQAAFYRDIIGESDALPEIVPPVPEDPYDLV